MPKWMCNFVYRVSGKRWAAAEEYWFFYRYRDGLILSLRDIRKTILKDSYAVKDRNPPGHIVGLKFRGRVWL